MSVDGQSVTGPEGTISPQPASSQPGAGKTHAPRRAVVVGGNRIPFARTGGAYTKSSNQDMLTAALDGLIARFGLQDEVTHVSTGGGA